MNDEKIREMRQKGFTPAACVHCGEVYWLPKETAKQYSASKPYECTHCLNMMRDIYGRA